MQIVFSEDSFHEMSKPVLWKKKNNKKNCHQIVICWISQGSGKGSNGQSIKFTLLCWAFNNKLSSQNILIVFFFLIFSFFLYLFIFFFNIILDVYNGLNLPFQLVGYSHLFCFQPLLKSTFCSDLYSLDQTIWNLDCLSKWLSVGRNEVYSLDQFQLD